MRLGLPLALTAVSLAAVAWTILDGRGEGATTPTLPPSDPAPEPADAEPPLVISPAPKVPVRPPDVGRAKALASVGEPVLAVEELGRALAADPTNLEARRLRAGLFTELGYARRAAKDLRYVVESDAATADDLDALAQAVMLSKPAEAQRLLERSLEENSGRARPHALLARIHLRAGREDAARAEVDLALSLDPYEPLAISLDERLSR